MSNSAASRLFVVARQFRGARLYLVDHAAGSAAFVWSANIRQAMRFDAIGAAQMADKARAQYGADCAPIDATGHTVNIAPRPASVAAAMRDVIARHYSRGRVNRETLAADIAAATQARGEKFSAKESAALWRAVTAYENERAAERIGRSAGMKKTRAAGKHAAARKRGAFKARA